MHEQPPSRRDPGPARRAWLRRPAVIAPLGLLVLLLGVGVGVLVGFAHRSPHLTSSPSCPLPRQTVIWPSPPTQVVRYAPTNTSVSVTLQVSATLEVDLPTGLVLSSLPSTYAPVLTLETPAGYTDASGTQCVWRFLAQHAGVVPLEFLGSGGCPVPAASCAMVSFQVSVTVTAATGASLKFRIRRAPRQARNPSPQAHSAGESSSTTTIRQKGGHSLHELWLVPIAVRLVCAWLAGGTAAPAV